MNVHEPRKPDFVDPLLGEQRARRSGEPEPEPGPVEPEPRPVEPDKRPGPTDPNREPYPPDHPNPGGTDEVPPLPLADR